MTDNRTAPLKVALSTMKKEGYHASFPKAGNPEVYTLGYNKDGVNRLLYFKKSNTDLDKISKEVKTLLDRSHAEQMLFGPHDLALKDNNEYIGD